MSRLNGMRPIPSAPVITMASRHSIGGAVTYTASGNAASGASPWSDAANSLLAFPFWLEAHTTTFYKGFWVNGTAAGSNSEVGIWDADYNKIITTGSVAGSGNSVPQAAAWAGGVTSVTLPQGLYYAGMAHNATTTGQIYRWSATNGIGHWQSFGCWRQSGITLGSLGATATPGDITNAAFPLFGLITRSVFDV